MAGPGRRPRDAVRMSRPPEQPGRAYRARRPWLLRPGRATAQSSATGHTNPAGFHTARFDSHKSREIRPGHATTSDQRTNARPGHLPLDGHYGVARPGHGERTTTTRRPRPAGSNCSLSAITCVSGRATSYANSQQTNMPGRATHGSTAKQSPLGRGTPPVVTFTSTPRRVLAQWLHE
jgi:hypothetical protein